jgi:hypothetical protein
MRKPGRRPRPTRSSGHYGDSFGLALYSEDDYVDAGDGTLVQVKDVTPGRQTQQPRRIVEAVKPSLPAPAPQPTSKAGLDDTKARLNALFAEGKRKLGWSTKRDMVLYVANVLHRHDMTAEGLLELSKEDLQIVGAVLFAEPGLEQAS